MGNVILYSLINILTHFQLLTNCSGLWSTAVVAALSEGADDESLSHQLPIHVYVYTRKSDKGNSKESQQFIESWHVMHQNHFTEI